MSTSAIDADDAEIGEAGHAVALLVTPQGTMPEKCERSGSTLSAMPCSVTQRGTRMPMAAILSSQPVALVGPAHPDADAVLAPLAAHVEGGERADQPFLQRRHIAPHVRPAALEVEHHIGDALARARDR